MRWNPFLLLKNALNDALIALAGTWVGSPNDPPWDHKDD